MFESGGLLGSYYGRMWLSGIFAFLGLLGSIALTVVTHLRKGLPLTTQTDRITGIKSHGVGRWFVTFFAFLAGPWLLLMIGLTGTHYVLMLAAWVVANWWVVPVVLALALTAGAVWAYVRRGAVGDPVEAVQLAALPDVAATPAVASQPALGWSLPSDAPHWSDRT